MSGQPIAPWYRVWAAADRLEATALTLLVPAEEDDQAVRQARQALVNEAADLNRLGFRLVAEAIDRELWL